MKLYPLFATPVLLAVLVSTQGVLAEDFVGALAAPDCLGGGQALPIDNGKVLQLKNSTPNQYLARAHISGSLSLIYPDHNGHHHFEIRIGAATQDTIEVVYNSSFGELPDLHAGMSIEACGDYITSTAATGQYPASPDSAIIHWIHKNPSGHGHESGFLAIDGVTYGQDNGHGG